VVAFPQLIGSLLVAMQDPENQAKVFHVLLPFPDGLFQVAWHELLRVDTANLDFEEQRVSLADPLISQDVAQRPLQVTGDLFEPEFQGIVFRLGIFQEPAVYLIEQRLEGCGGVVACEFLRAEAVAVSQVNDGLMRERPRNQAQSSFIVPHGIAALAIRVPSGQSSAMPL